MANILPTLNDYVRRLSRREIRANIAKTKKATSQYRRDIAALKRAIKALASRLVYVEKRSNSAAAHPKTDLSQNIRFRSDGLRTHRAKLGLSAKDFGQLVGVSGLTVYNWEAGKSKPRRKQLQGLVAIRGLGKREALKRLGHK